VETNSNGKNTKFKKTGTKGTEKKKMQIWWIFLREYKKQ